MDQEFVRSNNLFSESGSDGDASFIFNHQEDNSVPYDSNSASPKRKQTMYKSSQKATMKTQPQSKYFNPSPKVFWFALATFVILTLAIVVIVIIVCQTNKHLRNCKNELQQQKRETLHYQELLEKRMSQMIDDNDDLMPEIMDEQDINLAAQEQQSNRGSLSGQSHQQQQQTTDPNGSRIRREETRVGDLMMDREMRTKSIRMQSGSITFPKK